eukprot:COSAG01_NODE_2346_length_7859_cov_60.187500_7_plen_85_part_00
MLRLWLVRRLVTFWMYILPTSQMPGVVGTARFWFGLLYCTLPLNMLVYVWNDFSDFEYDQQNLRKDSYDLRNHQHANQTPTCLD